MSFFEGVLHDADDRLTRATTTRGLYQKKLARPANLTNEDVSDDLFPRLAVAFGLSFDRFDIGEIKPPHAIEDMAPAKANRPDSFVSKDQV